MKRFLPQSPAGIVVLLFATIGVMAVTAVLLERSNRVDASAATIPWVTVSDSTSIPDDMILVPGGEYRVGDETGSSDAGIREVELEPYLLDRHEVTNRQFREFVAETGWVTSAEQAGGAWVYRGGAEEWEWVNGANWRQPLGAGSSIEGADDHPVVLVSWHDATAYAEWEGKRLPTEAEWEVAARSLLAPTPSRGSGHAIHAVDDQNAPFPGGSVETAKLGMVEGNPAHDGSANVWQGEWPRKNLLVDGFFYTAPVGSFDPNELGFHDLIGNVWEWTADPYGDDHGRRIAKGGSWFCSENYCGAYRPGFRGKSPATAAFNNIGFRCAKDAL